MPSLPPPWDWVVPFALVVVILGGLLQLLTIGSRTLQRWSHTPRGLLREARRAASRGDHTRAGDLFGKAGELDLAIGEFERAEAWDEAARLAAGRGHHRRASGLFERANLFEDAAEQARAAGDLRRAEQMFIRAHKRIFAGTMYEEAEELALAAQVFAECNRPKRAAELYERLGRPGDAAKLYARYFDRLKIGAQGRHRGSRKAEIEDLADRVARLFDQADDHEGLLAFFQTVGRWERAAEVAAAVGETDQAIELFLKAGREDRAALVLETAGQLVRAARLRGDLALRNAELHSAARHYEAAGAMRLAAQVHEQLGSYEQAAKAYENAGDPRQAAYFYGRVGKFEKAAALYDRAGDVDQAVRCYETTGDIARGAELLDRAGRSFEAGRFYMRLGKFDDAIRCLQNVPEMSPSLEAASALLGVAFFEKGEMRIARSRLEKAVDAGGAGTLASPTAEVRYALGRVYQEAGEMDKARDEYERVLTLNFTYRDTADRLAEVRAALGDEADPIDADDRDQETQTRYAVHSLVTELETPSPDRPPARVAAGLGVDSAVVSILGAGASRPALGAPGRYELLEEIGRGGMGVVYRCHDKLLDRMVAYKVLGAQIRDFPAALQSFVREAQSAARLNHPNIVTLYDFGETAEGYYMTLEYVAGLNLRQFVSRRAPDQKTMRGVLIGICNGLTYAHSQSVVHRDIKPSNVLVSDLDLKAKILDFGLAKVIERAGQTASGILGTPWYMSPEQVLGTTTDHRTDLYSFGVTLFEIFTGRLPFKGRDFGYHHVHTEPPRADGIEPRLAPALGKLIDRCLVKDPDRRFQTADEIRQALHSADLFEPGLFQKRDSTTAGEPRPAERVSG